MDNGRFAIIAFRSRQHALYFSQDTEARGMRNTDDINS